MKYLLSIYITFQLIFQSDIISETIFIKYKGEVTLEQTLLTEIKLNESELVKRIFYDKRNQYLVVKLKHTYYHYCGIPPSKLKQWIQADSLGAYYRRHIRSNYDCRYSRVPY